MLANFAGGDTLQAGKRDYTAEEQEAVRNAQAAGYDSFKAYKDEGWDAYWAKDPEWVGTRGAQATKYASGSGRLSRKTRA